MWYSWGLYGVCICVSVVCVMCGMCVCKVTMKALWEVGGKGCVHIVFVRCVVRVYVLCGMYICVCLWYV